jgi:hypothetical protein
MWTFVKRVLGLGLLAGLAYGVWRAWNARVAASSSTRWENSPFPFPPVPRPPEPEAPVARWVEPLDDGTCPATHPVKAKVRSGIYHEPGGANYDRTKPDRCYVDAAAAEADGLRRSKV